MLESEENFILFPYFPFFPIGLITFFEAHKYITNKNNKYISRTKIHLFTSYVSSLGLRVSVFSLYNFPPVPLFLIQLYNLLGKHSVVSTHCSVCSGCSAGSDVTSQRIRIKLGTGDGITIFI